MKKLFFALMMLVSVPLLVRADPPRKITVTYNNETKKLNIEIVHPVKDVADHYIDMISIKVNDKEVQVIKPKKQSDAKNEILNVSVPEIAKGSKVTVKVRCNKFGSKSKTITIE